MTAMLILCAVMAVLGSLCATAALFNPKPDWTQFVVSTLVCLLCLTSGWLILTK